MGSFLRFLGQILIFASISLAMSIGLESAIVSAYRLALPDSHFVALRRLLLDHPESTAFFGNSRVAHIVLELVSSNAFGVKTSALPPDFQFGLLPYFCRVHSDNPVILELYENRALKPYDRNYALESNLLVGFPEVMECLRKAGKVSWIQTVPGIRYFGTANGFVSAAARKSFKDLLAVLRGNHVAEHPSSGRNEGSWMSLRREMVLRRQRHVFTMADAFRPEEMDAIYNAVKNATGRPLVILRSPLFSEYVESLGPVEQVTESLLARLSQIPHVTALDYTHLFDGEPDHGEKYFFDCVHLNEAGAQIFTRRLVADLKSRGVLK